MLPIYLKNMQACIFKKEKENPVGDEPLVNTLAAPP
jgi:hypothetical protein